MNEWVEWQDREQQYNTCMIMWQSCIVATWVKIYVNLSQWMNEWMNEWVEWQDRGQQNNTCVIMWQSCVVAAWVKIYMSIYQSINLSINQSINSSLLAWQYIDITFSLTAASSTIMIIHDTMMCFRIDFGTPGRRRTLYVCLIVCLLGDDWLIYWFTWTTNQPTNQPTNQTVLYHHHHHVCAWYIFPLAFSVSQGRMKNQQKHAVVIVLEIS